MKYVTGIYALNLPCELLTTGDWHTSALNWTKVQEKESRDSVFGEYGIETNKLIPEHNRNYNVANHLRAILDLLAEKNFPSLGNFKDDYICNDDYTEELFKKVLLLLPDEEINKFMHKTYGRKWRLWIGQINTAK